MKELTLEELATAVSNSWCYETSASADKWIMENPALGQCAVTACIIQDYFGGNILNSVVTLPDGSVDSHYYNVIEGEDLDLTKQQFPADSSFSEGQPKTKGHASTRDNCLSYEATRLRYQILKEKVEKKLGS